jgi:tetratricopeptide (TPR) repeat protein
MSQRDRLFQEAVAYHQRGDLNRAERAYQKLLRADGQHQEALRLLGCLYLQTQKAADAYRYLARAQQGRPTDSEILNNLASAARMLGRPDEAIALYQKAINHEPGNAGALHNLGSAYYHKGELAAAVGSYQSALAVKPLYPEAHNSLANTLRDLARFPEAIIHYQTALAQAPNYPDAKINLALTHEKAGHTDAAHEVYRQAIIQHPGHPVLLNNYGNFLRNLGRFEAARQLYQQALEVRPDYLNAHINFATVSRDLGNLEAALASYQHVLARDPASIPALNNIGTLMQDLGRLEEAEQYYTRALSLEPTSIEARWNQSLVNLAMGKYTEGWQRYQAGFWVQDKRGTMAFDATRLWDGSDFSGKRLLIWAEQGLGDTLQFIRYAELCKQRGGEVYLMCPAPLQALLANSPAIDRVFTTIEADAFDWHVPMMNLPYIFGTTLETIPKAIPYLAAGPAAQQKWQAIFADHGGKQLKVGLVWAGGIREHQPFVQLIDKRRSMQLTQFLPLFDLEKTGIGVRFYSLQIGPPAAQIESSGLKPRLIDLTGQIANFEDTAAMIEQLDLIIAVDTAVVHLAGGLGKKTWVLSRFDACWRWLRNRTDSPWYPSLRIFGQPKPGDWDSVISSMCKALKTEIDALSQ